MTIFTKKNLLITLIAAGTVTSILAWYFSRQVSATPEEAKAALAGDEFVQHPIGVVTHAITIRGTPQDVWPWLAQMGSGRGGWYAYDFIDNGGNPSTKRLIAEFQNIKIGDVFPALPGQQQVFSVMRLEPGRDLVLGWRQPSGSVQTSWAFILTETKPGETRLVVRGRIARGYRPLGLPEWIAVLMAKPAHFVMERRQLLNLTERVKNTSGAN